MIRPRQLLPDQSSSLVLKAQRDVDVAQSLHLDFAFLFTVPVGDPVRLDLDEHDVRRVDTLVEPTIEVACPVRFECSLIADEFRRAFDCHINRIGKDPAFAGKSERNFGVGFYVGDGSRMLVGEIVPSASPPSRTPRGVTSVRGPIGHRNCTAPLTACRPT